eukprot:COSAG02_NODE_2030_length_10067_cov_22.885333_9_plen_80_part_00
MCISRACCCRWLQVAAKSLHTQHSVRRRSQGLQQHVDAMVGPWRAVGRTTQPRRARRARAVRDGRRTPCTQVVSLRRAH